jgi:hypothetical protein
VKAWLLAVLAGAGCAEKAPPTKGATELRVPLPEGWVATGSNDTLLAGPRGRPVVSLESKAQPLPTAAQLLTALEAQKVVAQGPAEKPQFVGVRYTLDGGSDAFIGVKTVGTRTVWCATLAAATEAEVGASEQLCSTIELR